MSIASETKDVSTDARAVSASAAPAVRKLSWRVPAAYLLLVAIWGTTWFGVRVCVQPDGFMPYPAAAIRFTIAAALLACFCLIRRETIVFPPFGKAKWLATAGCLSGAGYALTYFAMHDAPGGIGAVMSAMAPFMTALLAAITRTEKLSRISLIGSLFALLGVALVFHDRLSVSAAQAGAVGLLVASNFVAAGSNVAIKHNGKGSSPLALNTIFFTFCALCLWIGAALSHQLSVPWPPPAVPTAALLYLTLFGTLIAFGSFFYLLSAVRLSTAMTITFITPLVALVVDAFFEKQIVLSAESYIGMAIVLTSVAASVLLQARFEKK